MADVETSWILEYLKKEDLMLSGEDVSNWYGQIATSFILKREHNRQWKRGEIFWPEDEMLLWIRFYIPEDTLVSKCNVQHVHKDVVFQYRDNPSYSNVWEASDEEDVHQFHTKAEFEAIVRKFKQCCRAASS